MGEDSAKLNVYIANRPPLEYWQQLAACRTLTQGEISHIVEQTGNHWRKIFNCYAKLAFSLHAKNELSWQSYRDNRLLQAKSDERLLFSPPDFSNHKQIHIICGKSYFQSMVLPTSVIWIDNYFAINKSRSLIISPYFDYRQLTNQRLEQLAELISEVKP